MKKLTFTTATNLSAGAIKTFIVSAALMFSSNINAQLSSNPDKFLGNITTRGQVNGAGVEYKTLWNQITCENESKWASVEGTNNSFNWGGCDNAYNYAKNNNFPFKFHALIWGAQYPKWLESQTPEQRYKEIVQWMDQVKKRYPNLQLIDVVNEAITGHQAGTPYFIEALGGTGKTGYDWLIKAFELAYERWPNAILIYNDFNTFQWQKSEFIDLVRTLRDAGAPIDAYGCQSHDLTDMGFSSFKSAMTEIQNALKMPMYSTEYDIGTSDDNKQLQQYKDQIPYMWEQDYVAGITLWGYLYGATWTTDGNSGIIKNGKDRPAMTWLREYMKSDKAKNAKSPFPGMVKEASVYVKPASLTVEKEVPTSITVRASMRTKTIEKIDLYVKNNLVATMTEAPYVTEFTPTTTGKHEIKAVVTCTDGTTYERLSSITSSNPRAPYKNKPTELPGVLQTENFDSGADGIAFHDNNKNKQGTGSAYRTDDTGIDIEKGGTGYVIGYGEPGEWMEYTVDVKEAGMYAYTIYYSAPEAGASINLSLSTPEGQTSLTAANEALARTGDWSTYKNAYGRLLLPLEAGQQVLRLGITGGSGQYVINIDKITFERIEINDDIDIALSTDPAVSMVGTKTTIAADVKSDTEIKDVKFYVNGTLNKTVTSAPFATTYTPSTKGEYLFTAIATDVDGKQSKIASYNLKVTAKRSPYKTAIAIPGIIQAENFDKGEEGLTWHDSDTDDQGAAKYRTDNGGVDIVTGNGGYALGYTAVNEWTEYTINVKEPGKYAYEATVSSGVSNSGFTISLVEDGKTTQLCKVSVPQTGNNSWDTYKVVKGNFSKELAEGTQVLRFTITGANCNIDKVELKCTLNTDIESITIDAASTNTETYNLQGMKVDTNYKGIIIKNGKKFIRR